MTDAPDGKSILNFVLRGGKRYPVRGNITIFLNCQRLLAKAKIFKSKMVEI
jgi:hypothetical protein